MKQEQRIKQRMDLHWKRMQYYISIKDVLGITHEEASELAFQDLKYLRYCKECNGTGKTITSSGEISENPCPECFLGVISVKKISN